MRDSGNLDANKDRDDDGNLISFNGNRCSTRVLETNAELRNKTETLRRMMQDNINLTKDAGSSVQFRRIEARYEGYVHPIRSLESGFVSVFR